MLAAVMVVGRAASYLWLAVEALPGERHELQLAGREVVGRHLRWRGLARRLLDQGAISKG